MRLMKRFFDISLLLICIPVLLLPGIIISFIIKKQKISSPRKDEKTLDGEIVENKKDEL